jgi:hypothetical protein
MPCVNAKSPGNPCYLCSSVFIVANKEIKRGWPADDMAALAAMRPILQTRNR